MYRFCIWAEYPVFNYFLGFFNEKGNKVLDNPCIEIFFGLNEMHAGMSIFKYLKWFCPRNCNVIF